MKTKTTWVLFSVMLLCMFLVPTSTEAKDAHTQIKIEPKKDWNLPSGEKSPWLSVYAVWIMTENVPKGNPDDGNFFLPGVNYSTSDVNEIVIDLNADLGGIPIRMKVFFIHNTSGNIIARSWIDDGINFTATEAGYVNGHPWISTSLGDNFTHLEDLGIIDFCNGGVLQGMEDSIENNAEPANYILGNGLHEIILSPWTYLVEKKGDKYIERFVINDYSFNVWISPYLGKDYSTTSPISIMFGILALIGAAAAIAIKRR